MDIPKVNVRLDYDDGLVQMTTYPDIKRIEEEDDGSFTAVVTSLPVIIKGAPWIILSERQPEPDTDVIFFDARQGRMFIDNYDHDSTPEWWIRRGVTLWKSCPNEPEESQIKESLHGIAL